jgi:hypothetical protein
LLSRAEDAKAAKNYESALTLIKRASTLYPQEASRLNELIATTHLQRAEDEATAGRFSEALNDLLEAYSADLPGRLSDRYRQRYADYYAQQVAGQIGALAKQNGWRSVGIVAFSGQDSFEGEAIAARVSNAVSKQAGLSASLRALSPVAVASIIKGEADSLPDTDQTRVAGYNDDATIAGRVGKDLAAYAYDARGKKVHALQSVQSLGTISGVPQSAIWDKLLAKRKSNSNFRVDVWTEQTGYRIGGELTVNLRANRDCYVTVLDLQTSGNLYVLLPNQYQSQASAKANVIYTVPSSDAPFTIAVNGPAGVEGIKVIATRRPLSLVSPESGRVFAALSTSQAQEKFGRSLVSQIEKLNDDEWDVAEWTFEITK